MESDPSLDYFECDSWRLNVTNFLTFSDPKTTVVAMRRFAEGANEFGAHSEERAQDLCGNCGREAARCECLNFFPEKFASVV